MVKRGLTAIELLASTTLAAMLMTAVVGVLGGLAAQQKRLPTVEPWRDQLRHVLAWDLRHSQEIRLDEQALELDGFASHDFATGTPSFERCTVRYEIVDGLLIRRETHPDLWSNANSQSDLVLLGVDRFAMTPQEGALPERLTITLVDTSDQVIFTHAFVVR